MFSYNTKLVDRGWVWKKTVRKKGKTKGRIDTHYEKAFGSRKAYLRSITKIEEYLHCVDRHNNEEYLLLFMPFCTSGDLFGFVQQAGRKWHEICF